MTCAPIKPIVRLTCRETLKTRDTPADVFDDGTGTVSFIIPYDLEPGTYQATIDFGGTMTFVQNFTIKPKTIPIAPDGLPMRDTAPSLDEVERLKAENAALRRQLNGRGLARVTCDSGWDD